MGSRGKNRKEFSELSNQVIGAAIEVHKELGPGLLERIYEQCLAHELKMRNINVELQSPLPVNYKGQSFECGYRVDMLVENEIIVELKHVEQLAPIHEAQLLTYMKLADIKQGFLMNFNVKKLKDGLKSFVF